MTDLLVLCLVYCDQINFIEREKKKKSLLSKFIKCLQQVTKQCIDSKI